MNEKKFLKEKLCRRFCRYYKPDKEEELACQGFVVISRLREQGKEIPFLMSEHAVDPEEKNALIEALCKRCDFFEDGCDFVAGEVAASPCGGFALLLQLVGEGIITIDDAGNIL